jgi:hypothetical protein
VKPGSFLKDSGSECLERAEHLLNFRLQIGYSGATEESVRLIKQMKIGPCEQVRVN